MNLQQTIEAWSGVGEVLAASKIIQWGRPCPGVSECWLDRGGRSIDDDLAEAAAEALLMRHLEKDWYVESTTSEAEEGHHITMTHKRVPTAGHIIASSTRLAALCAAVSALRGEGG